MYLTTDEAANELLAKDPNALVVGMILDQQVPLEKAFAGPKVIAERMDGQFDLAAIAAMAPEAFAKLASTPPAIHRFPKAMAERVQKLAAVVVGEWDGHVANLYASAKTGAELKRAISALPGFGEQKASIFVALLGKQCGITPDGWREAAGDYAQEGFRSVADITDPESLADVRAHKRMMKEAAKRAEAAVSEAE